MRPVLATLALLAGASAQEEPFRPELAPASDEGRTAMAGFELPPGFEVELVAAEPGLANPVAFTIAHDGRLFVVETFRLHMGVTDMRRHRGWLEEDLAATSVADRVANQREHQADQLAQFRQRHERIRVLYDDDGDRVFERSQVFADGWNRIEDGIAAGVLVDGEDVWMTNIPSLWRLRDSDGDGRADERKALQTGYGVHVSLLGHDMHGLVIGPDRRLYFSIGDRGFNVRHEGEHHFHPHEGAVLRCELDGSDLEVVHRGLRNPQELAFDDHGNLFTGDNNSDGGDRARWVYVVDGGNSGWCIGYQWLDDRGAWNREKLWHPHFPGQAAWIVPPIFNVASGPSGLAAYPGTGLPERYRNSFFLCDFRGNPAFSGVWNLKVVPSGASFEPARRERFAWKVLPTDVGFGIEGGLYLADWVTGWDQTGKGRVYRIHAPTDRTDMRVLETRRLLSRGLEGRPVHLLTRYLDHDDRRVRQEAGFALVDHGDAGLEALASAARAPTGLRPRLHGIQGVGIAAREDPGVLDTIAGLLDDGEAEVRARTACVMGDAGYEAATPALIEGTRDPNSRVRFFSAQALGRIGAASAVPALIALLADDAGRDPYLRHAASLALARIGDRDALLDHVEDPRPAVRMGVLLALRRLGDPALAGFLDDPEPLLVVEAARAIYDFEPVRDALPALAALSSRAGLKGAGPPEDALVLRVLGARRHLGRGEDAAALMAFARREEPALAMREEALAILGEWNDPSGRDRVFGNWRPVEHEEAPAGELVAGFTALLGGAPDRLREAAARAVAGLGMVPAGEALAALVLDPDAAPTARNAALVALDALDAPALVPTLDALDARAPVRLRKTAVRILGRIDPPAAVGVVESLMTHASTGERQNAVRTLAGMKTPAARDLLAGWLRRMTAGEVPPDLHLDLLEAAAANDDHEGIATALRRWEQQRPDDPLAPWLACLHGGDADRGGRLFRNHAAASCTRCHTLDGRGGEAGPVLDGIGARRDRRHLLEALVRPDATITEGYGTVAVTTTGGELHVGILAAEDEDSLTLMNPDGERVRLRRDQIRERNTAPSSMPPMAGVLGRRELRDVVAFLAAQR